MVSRKSRRTRKTRKMKRGGFMAPVNVADTMPQRDSLAQGSQYLNAHKGQYGGSAPYPSSVNMSSLPPNMVQYARTGPLDSALQQIQGMQDGGKHKRSHKRSHKRTHKHNKRSHKRSHKHNKRSHKRTHKHRGGAFVGSPLSENPMLLPSGLERQAALHHEWSMAKDSGAFLPNQ